MIHNQQDYWDTLAKIDPDSVVIDLNDTPGHKNKYIGYIRNRVIYEHVREYGDNKLVLDFGCGSGLTTEFLHKNNIDVIGIDISLQLLKKANSRLNNRALPVLQYDGIKIPINTKTIDSAVTYVVLNHIINEQHLVDVLKEIKRVLKDNGRVFAIEQTRRKTKLNKDGSKKQLSINDFKKLFINSGLRVESCKIIRYGHFPLIYLIRYGLVSDKWFNMIAAIESFVGKFYKVPLLDYADTLFILKKDKL